MAKKQFWIGERHNPQLKNPYYIAYGQLTKVEAKKKEDAMYGSVTVSSYPDEDTYRAKIKSLRDDGFKVSVR